LVSHMMIIDASLSGFLTGDKFGLKNERPIGFPWAVFFFPVYGEERKTQPSGVCIGAPVIIAVTNAAHYFSLFAGYISKYSGQLPVASRQWRFGNCSRYSMMCVELLESCYRTGE
jgi:hypothetical protein